MKISIQDQVHEAQRRWELSQAPTDELKKELLSRGFIVTDAKEFDEQTGLLKFTATDGTDHYFNPDTHKLVDYSEAYKRASGGY